MHSRKQTGDCCFAVFKICEEDLLVAKVLND